MKKIFVLLVLLLNVVFADDYDKFREYMRDAFNKEICPQESFTRLDKLCKDGYGEACYDMSVAYYNEYSQKPVRVAGKMLCTLGKDSKKTFLYAELGCKFNNASSCSHLGYLYQTEKKDCKKAMQFYEKACNNKNGSACNNLGVCYQKGLCVAKNEKKALSFFIKGCKYNDDKACAQIMFRYKDKVKIEDLK